MPPCVAKLQRSLTSFEPRGIDEVRGRFSDPTRSRRIAMVWELPSFVEIEMNAEIGSYQEDYDGL
jgi:hypothetical protein